MMERDYVGLSEASSAARDGEEEEEEEEIELGLSLGAKKITAGKNRAAAGGWGRILTAKDFPTAMGSRASPLSSSSSVSSSEGAKRVADNDGAASNNPPSQVFVGWPPIRDFRIKNTLINKDNSSSEPEAIANKKNNQNNKADACIATKSQDKRACAGNVGATRFVKVNMDGDPIGRKVDLSAHQSYETLALALELMFHKPTTGLVSSGYCAKASKLLDGSSEFALTYEDKDGDWMLVGDVPWGMFLDTVKRLRIMRTSDANGLAPNQGSTGGLLRSNPTYLATNTV